MRSVEPDAIIPRAVLAGNPERAQMRVSPDGRMLSWLAPVDGVMNVWVAPVGRLGEARSLTRDRGRGIGQHMWAYNSTHVLYLQDEGGDENWKLHGVEVATGTDRNLTPFDSIPGPDGKPIMLPSGQPMRPAARVEAMSPSFPNEIVIGLNNRNPQLHDLYRLNVVTGELTLMKQNDGFVGFALDDGFNVRAATRPTADGGFEYLRAEPTGSFSSWQVVPGGDALTTQLVGFTKDGSTSYWIDSRGRNTGALLAMDMGTGRTRVLAEDARTDADGTLVHPVTREVQAVSFTYERSRWQAVDRSIRADLEALTSQVRGDVRITSRTVDDRLWTVASVVDNGPLEFYLYDRSNRRAELLFTSQPALERLPLARTHPRVIRSRDGLSLVSYLTLPRWTDVDENGVPDAGPVPMVLLVHGGPWARDTWGLDQEVQWLANRGYGVLQVNFRGSTGFGKSFVNAGNKEWAGKMHDDLIDGVNWAVQAGVAQRDRVAIMGASYGGYAALVGLTFTPEVFAAGVSVVGPSNLVTLLNTIPPYWEPLIALFTTRVGDHRTAEGRALLESRSPLNFVDRIQRPLLIGQGANDPRVKQSESDQIVAAMKGKGIPVAYVLFPDEGHGFARPENRMSFNAVAEAFLAAHLGGRVEPVGDDFKGSSITIPAGVEKLPGAAEALGRR